MTFTGEFIDWDSGTSGFLGIYAATFTVRGDATLTDSTAPNGRWEMCIPKSDGLADVVPTAASTYVGGVVVIDKAVHASLPMESYRSFKTARAAEMGYDAALAQVWVHVHGGTRTVTTSAAPAISKVFDNLQWVDGTTGSDFYLGNIPVSDTTKLVVTGGKYTGPTTIPLTAGQFTYVTIVANN
jgi:hypothetical protein